MTENRKFRDFQAAIAAVLSLGLSVATVIFLKRQFCVEDTTILVILLVVPFLIYVIVSRRILEFRAPGGWHLIFARSTIEREKIPITPIIAEKNKEIGKLTIEELKKRPTALKFILTGENDLDYRICDYLDALAEAATFKYVIFTNSSNEFIALIPAKDILAAPELMSSNDECKVVDLIDWIINRNLDEISKLQGFIWKEESASPDWKKRYCLEVFQRENVDALPVIRNNLLIGVIEKSQLIASLVLDFATSLEE